MGAGGLGRLVPPVPRVAADEYIELLDEADVPFYGESGYYRGYEARMAQGQRRQALEAESERAGVRPGARIFVFAVTAEKPDAICHTAHVGHRWIDNVSISSTVADIDPVLRVYYADNLI